MRDDPLSAAIDDVETAAAALHEAVSNVTDELIRARQLRREGRPVTEIVEHLVAAGGRELRLTPVQACTEYERAVTAYRSAAIRDLVDVEGLSFTQVATMTGVSRQMVAKLYRATPPAGPS